MFEIAKHTGQNSGGVASLEFAFPGEFSTFQVLPGFRAVYSFTAPALWKSIYATAKTFSGSGSSERNAAGLLHKYSFRFRCPKDRSDLITALQLLQVAKVVVRITDANGLKRIYGKPDNPVSVTIKLLLPGEVQGFNGYEIALTVSSSDPAYTE
jgi:hypothetical protein